MYKGNHLYCGSCKYRSREYVKNNERKYSPCKAIDNDKIKLYPKIYGGYSESIRLCEICYHYEPADYIKNPEFSNIEEYIEFMDKEWYGTTKYYADKGINFIKHCRSVSLIIGDDWLEVPLYDWMNNSWRTGDTIKYIRLYKIFRNSKGAMKKRVRVDTLELGEYGYYEISK